MTDTDGLVAEILTVARGTTHDDRIAELREHVRSLERKAKVVREIMDYAMLAHIEATGRDIIIGETRYYAGIAKSTKCLDVADAVDAVWTAVGGDVAQFVGALRSDPFKPSICKELLPPEDFGRLFETIEKPELREGKPRKRLLSTRIVAGGNEHDDDN